MNTFRFARLPRLAASSISKPSVRCRLWHKADIPTVAAFVRFWTIADIGLRLMIENGCESEVTSSTPHTRDLIAMLVLVLAAAALAGCGASARTWAAADCWKSTEKNYAKMNIDKRADIVNKCIDGKLR